MDKTILRQLDLNDLEEYKYWKQPYHEYHLMNGPYYKKESELEIESFIELIKIKLKKGVNYSENKLIISNSKNALIGEVNWYWKSQETNWMEIGIVIFDEQFWKKGIGFQAIILWINKLFNEKPQLVRLGLSTWSGNIGMIELSKKLGMKKEAEYRNARIVDGKLYDSISYGILKNEWSH